MMLPEKGSDLCIKLIRPPLVGACEGIIFFLSMIYVMGIYVSC